MNKEKCVQVCMYIMCVLKRVCGHTYIVNEGSLPRGGGQDSLLSL